MMNCKKVIGVCLMMLCFSPIVNAGKGSMKKKCTKLATKLHGSKEGFKLGTVSYGKKGKIKLAFGKHDEQGVHAVVVGFSSKEGDDHCTCLFDSKKQLLNPSGTIERNTSQAEERVSEETNYSGEISFEEVDKLEETESAVDLNNLKHVYYKFHDASIPPPNHRDYSIKMDVDQVYYEESSYNGLINSTKVKPTAEQWTELKRLVGKITHLDKLEHSKSKGGSSQELRIMDQNGKNHIAFWDNQEDDSIAELIKYIKACVATADDIKIK